jgi:hypothetical protein
MGPLGKPLGCQTYPYQMVNTPGGTFVHLSFGCPPVVAGLDTNIALNRRELSDSLAFRHSAPPDTQPFQVQLTADKSISWDSYLELETRILQAYQPADPLASILNLVLDVCRASSLDQGWSSVGLVIENTEFPKELLVRYLGLVILSLENEQDLATFDALAVSIEDGETFYSSRFAMNLPALSAEPPGDGWILDTYHRYFRNAVLGKSLLKTTVVARLLATACAIALTGFYAQAYGEARGDEPIQLQDLIDAFEIVEVKVATHTRVTEPFFADLERTFAKVALISR